MSESQFVTFTCPSCHQEIEAATDLAGQEAECPACGTLITIPQQTDPALADAQSEMTPAQRDAMKSRTIRIELDL